MTTKTKTDPEAGRDMQEFEAKILDVAAKATPEEQAAAHAIVDKTDIAELFVLNRTTGGLRWKAGKEPLPAPTPLAPMAQAA